MFSLEHLAAIRKAEIEQITPLIPPGSRILEIGAGTGKQALELQRLGHNVTAVEIGGSRYAAERVFPVIDYEGQRLPVPDRNIDIVFTSNVLEHVTDLASLFAEMHRVLVPDGRAIHVLPTHSWRFWTTLTSVPDALAYAAVATPDLIPRSWPTEYERARLTRSWIGTLRRVGGRLYQRRHGERGNVITETWLFRPDWWRRKFVAHGFAIVHEFPMGLFYSGNMLLGRSLSLRKRRSLARVLGSACHAFVVRPR